MFVLEIWTGGTTPLQASRLGGVWFGREVLEPPSWFCVWRTTNFVPGPGDQFFFDSPHVEGSRSSPQRRSSRLSSIRPLSEETVKSDRGE